MCEIETSRKAPVIRGSLIPLPCFHEVLGYLKFSITLKAAQGYLVMRIASISRRPAPCNYFPQNLFRFVYSADGMLDREVKRGYVASVRFCIADRPPRQISTNIYIIEKYVSELEYSESIYGVWNMLIGVSLHSVFSPQR